jgi:hypothetical protein
MFPHVLADTLGKGVHYPEWQTVLPKEGVTMPSSPKQPRWQTPLAIATIASAGFNVVLTGALVYLGYQTGKTAEEQVRLFHDYRDVAAKQVKLFDDCATLVDKETKFTDRAAFDQALKEAESYCPACSLSPSYLIEIPLNKALGFEPRASEVLTAAEYIRLTALGSSVWEFEVSEQYAKKALAKSKTPLDRFMSNFLLGHVTFLNCGKDQTKLDLGRGYFKTSIACLQPKLGTDIGEFYLGWGYAIWAQHEAFLKNDDDCKQQRSFAESAWSKLPEGKDFVRDLDVRIELAKHGVRPDMSCFFGAKPGPCVAPHAPYDVPAPKAKAADNVPTLAPQAPAAALPIPAVYVPKTLTESKDERLKEYETLLRLVGDANFALNILLIGGMPPARIIDSFRKATSMDELYTTLDPDGSFERKGLTIIIQPHLANWIAGVTEIRQALELSPLK